MKAFEFQVSGFGFRVSSFGSRVWGLWFWVEDFGCRVSGDSGSRMWGSRLRVYPGIGEGEGNSFAHRCSTLSHSHTRNPTLPHSHTHTHPPTHSHTLTHSRSLTHSHTDKTLRVRRVLGVPQHRRRRGQQLRAPGQHCLPAAAPTCSIHH